MTYRISKKAQDDLIGIWEYTVNNWSREQADRYYRIIIEAIENASKHPLLGMRYENIRKNYFGMIIKSHIVFYRTANDEDIEVIRILHKHMDIENRLTE